MTRSARADCEIRMAMPATLQAAEEFCIDFRRRSQPLLNRANCFAAELLVREALTNAVVHGCHTDPARQVRCHWRLKAGRLLIAVGYDGGGFDWRAEWDKQADFRDCSGRGIEILRKYANRVRYNDRGNTVTIVKRFC